MASSSTFSSGSSRTISNSFFAETVRPPAFEMWATCRLRMPTSRSVAESWRCASLPVSGASDQDIRQDRHRVPLLDDRLDTPEALEELGFADREFHLPSLLVEFLNEGVVVVSDRETDRTPASRRIIGISPSVVAVDRSSMGDSGEDSDADFAAYVGRVTREQPIGSAALRKRVSRRLPGRTRPESRGGRSGPTSREVDAASRPCRNLALTAPWRGG